MNLNNGQRKILVVSGLCVFLALLFPPFIYQFPNHSIRSAGYSFILMPPNGWATIDSISLLLEWFGILMCAGIALVWSKDQ